ncbi:MAG: potassium-transporting ATPase subunit C [Longimicrobiales bacterium]
MATSTMVCCCTLLMALSSRLSSTRPSRSASPLNGAVLLHPRPSPNGYDDAASGASNKGPTDRKLADSLIAGAIAQASAETGATGALPADMVTGSGSALDPHISPAHAALQVARVRQARGVAEERVRALVQQHTEGRTFGLLGEPRINVLLLNIALDREFPR